VKEESIIRPRTAVSSDPNDFFFQSAEFVFRNRPKNVIAFTSEEDHDVLVKIFFTRTDTHIHSLDRSPFGGFIVSEKATEQHVLKLIDEFERWCVNNSVSEISVRAYPDIYNPGQSEMVHRILVSAGYKIVNRELLQVIHIDANSINGFNRNRKRKLKECIDAGFHFEQLVPDQLEQVYEIFVECRTAKGYPVTMSLRDFKREFKNFPDQYLLFGVKDKGELVAASVCVAVNNRILYDFFHGDKLSLRAFSPVTLLIKGIIDFCRARKFRLLDLGVSTDEEGVNAGLHQFKNSFGADTNQKLTFLKSITIE
jgi:hypothetical protein